MKTRLFVFGTMLFLFTVVSSQAQLNTLVLPSPNTTNITFNLSTNQVIEILTIAADPSVVVEYNNGVDTVTFGQGRIEFPYPFVMAGPATVMFKKTSTGGEGGIVTYRVSDKNPAPR